MTIDAWFPVGFTFPDNVNVRQALYDGGGWQIYESGAKGSTLVATENLAERWINDGLMDSCSLHKFNFGDNIYYSLSSGSGHILKPLSQCDSPKDKNEALAFAQTLKATREIDKESTLQDSIYVEKYSRLLPTYSISNPVADDVVLGYWLTGGVPVSINSNRRFRSLTGWISEDQIGDVIEKSGVKHIKKAATETEKNKKGSFTLAGRPYLQNFIIEHIIDIVENKERYKALGIDFPSAMILYGPPGCGKTFAVERLVEYLEWPSYNIEASSVASPYIHETSRKVATIFEQAMQNSPSVIVIDEMEAFLSDRQGAAGAGHHRIEEVSEFLRRIPEAVKNNVLIIGMTNQIDMIDPAILRRGRFDHVIKVDMASESEVFELLSKLIDALPREDSINTSDLAKNLCGRPLSDVSFVVREGARLAARAGKNKIDQESLLAALHASPSREDAINPTKKIGFV